MSTDEKGQKLCTTSGRPITPDHREIDPTTGMQKDYIVLCDEERAKGFVRPYRDTYKHVGVKPRYQLRDLTEDEKVRYAAFNYVGFEPYPESDSPVTGRYWTASGLATGCGTVTTMGVKLSETYARDPTFYGSTFCVNCRAHFPLEEFVWLDGSPVGS